MGSPYGALTVTTGLTIPHHTNYNFGLRDFSVDVAIKTAVTDGVILSKFDSGVGWKVELVGGQVVITFNGYTSTTSPETVSDNAWHYLHFSVNRDSETLTLFIDGTISTTDSIASSPSINNAVDVLVTPSIAATVAEIRLSNKVRYTEDYFIDGRQLIDDVWTVTLFHFNEGSGTTSYDMSAATRNHNTTLSGHTWATAPGEPNPITIVRDCVWLALDSYGPLTKFLNARLVRNSYTEDDQVHDGKYRFRPGDYIPSSMTPQNTPALVVVPASLSDIKEETSRYHQIMLPIEVEGSLYMGHVSDIEYFWWLCTKAVFRMYSELSTAGRCNFIEIQHMRSRGPSWTVEEQNDKSLFGSFTDTLMFEVHHDML